jgi:hypothetical protein
MSDRPPDLPLIPFLSSFGQDTRFPGRARLFCDQRLLGALPADLRARCEWPGAGAGLLLGAACGAAAAEGQRAGCVVVVLAAAGLKDPLVPAAVALAVRLHLGILTIAVVGDDATVIAPLVALGCTQDGDGPRVRWFAPVEAASLPPSTDVRREWQPVHLRTLLPGTLPPWPVDAASLPPAAASDWLAWLAIREPDLVVVNLAAGWREQVPGPTLVCALAQLAAEGRRVCWRLPSGTDLRPWLDALQEVGRRGLGLKLLINANDLPPRANLAALSGWWVMVPADTLEAAAMLAHALDSEDPVLMGLVPQLPVALPAWPARQAYHPGRGRWLVTGGTVTLCCDQRTVAVAAAAVALLAKDGIQAGLLLCTSVLPLPVGDLDQAGPGPLIACGSDLGIALASAMTDRDVHVDIVTDVATAVALVAGVRKVLPPR